MSKLHTVKPQVIRTPREVSRVTAMRMDAATGKPATLDEATRSVQVVASTEEPAVVMDWERWEPVDEVLLMSGCRLPPGGQVPLLDAHNRMSVTDVIGSFRSISVQPGATGPELVGTCVFAGTPDGDVALRKVAEGHLTDVSIGYEICAYMMIQEGETATVEGRAFTGPLRVVVEWDLKELSMCPIGADANAKVRQKPPVPAKGKAAGQKHKERTMSAKKTGGKQTAIAKARGLIARLLGRETTPEDEQEKREDVELLDADGNPAEPEELTTEELEAVVEELDAVLEEVQDELDADAAGERQDDEEEEGDGAERKRAARKGKRSAPVLRGRALTPEQIATVERARITAIRNLARKHNLPQETEDKFINDGLSLRDAKAKVLDMTEQRRGVGPGFTVAMGATEMEKVRAATRDTLLMRCGIAVEKPAPGADVFQSLPLSMLARELLMRSNQPVSGDIRSIVGRALTTTDLPMLLVETTRRVLMEAYEKAEETWRDWAQIGIAVDFKPSKAVGMEGDVRLKLKPEYGEYEQGKLAENAEEYFVETFGRKMVITREAIINDDLNALSALPRLYGEESAALVGDVAYKGLLSTSNKMGDGLPLFHAKHGNLFQGKGGVPTVENLGAIVTGMKLQKDSFNKPISIQPRYFIAPVALETACDQFFNTQLQGSGAVIGTGDKPIIHNPYGGTFFTRIHDRRLDEVDPGAFYLAAARGTVTVFFLGGVEAPYIEDQVNFNTDAVESKVRMDVGAKAMRWVTLAKATAPNP